MLGLHIDNHLNWKEQVNIICKRLNSTIALLKIINYYLCPEMKIMFYNSYFMSISDYCSFIWGKGKDCSHKITLIQKRATRIILNKPARTPSKPLFKELKWLTFPDRYNYHSALLVYKTLNDNAPSYMTKIISTANNVTYHLRSQSHKDLSFSTRPKTKYITDTFSY